MPALLLCLPQKPSQAQVGLTSVPSSARHKVSALSGVWMEPGCPGLPGHTELPGALPLPLPFFRVRVGGGNKSGEVYFFFFFFFLLRK